MKNLSRLDVNPDKQKFLFELRSVLNWNHDKKNV